LLLQLKGDGAGQHSVPAQPLAGLGHGRPSHEVTSGLQMRLKQLPSQQSPSRVQASPFTLAQRLPSAQQTVSPKQLLGVHWHCPCATLQLVPIGQTTHCAPPVPQTP
jgi:hypothetical protein